MKQKDLANASMDAVIALSDVLSAITQIVKDHDDAVKADVANDPYLTGGLDLIRSALSRMDPNSEAYKDLMAAKASFQRATDMDFEDLSIENSKRRIMPLVSKIENAISAFRRVNGMISGEVI